MSMEIQEQVVRSIVEKVLRSYLGESGAGVPAAVGSSLPAAAETAVSASIVKAAATTFEDEKNGIFSDMEKAIEAAENAHLELMKMTLEKRREIIRSVRETMLENIDRLCEMAVRETGMGNCRDKVVKNRLAILKTPGVEDLEPTAFTDDYGLTLIERSPYGVIGSITPSTNPTETLICNGIGMAAGGNSVVFNPHPSAKETSNFTISLFNKAAARAGGPVGLFSTIADPTIESAQAMMKHPKIRLLVVTGGPAVVKAAMLSGKKVIAAGPGNPPCVVDETADIDKAGKDVVNGAGLDNNIICICEKEILAVDRIAGRLKEALKKYGAYELNKSQTEKVTALVIQDPGRPGHEGAPNKKYVGKDAAVIAADLGLSLPGGTKILLCEVPWDHPLVWTEQLMPVIPLVRMSSADEAIDFAVQCEHGFRHTASMHSKNIDNLSRMAKVMNCSVFVKNGPNYNGLGHEGPGFTSYTIASPTGEGMTRARTFTRERRCALIGHFRIV
jgi:acyl-CoA reductase-like NAD-dependent aldehyde dehydrogenase